MDLSVKVTFDVSPKLEELVFHVLAAQFANKDVVVREEESVAQPEVLVPRTATENDISGTEVPKAEAEKIKEVADLPLDGDELIEIRKQASEFMGKNHKDNTKAIKDWLDARNIERVTLIPRSMVEEFRKDVLGIAG